MLHFYRTLYYMTLEVIGRVTYRPGRCYRYSQCAGVAREVSGQLLERMSAGIIGAVEFYSRRSFAVYNADYMALIIVKTAVVIALGDLFINPVEHCYVHNSTSINSNASQDIER